MALNTALNFRHAPRLHKGSRQKLRPVSLIVMQVLRTALAIYRSAEDRRWGKVWDQ